MMSRISDSNLLKKAGRVIGWYLFWLVVVLFLYRSSLLMFPKKDHFFFMLGRQLFDNDLVWFLKTLSYNRTRMLFPGDYFAFRPVLMAILGLEDIFLRHHLLILGIVGCGLFSFTATMLFTLSRRLTGMVPAIFVTLIWCSNLAGSEALLWQHITPYVLAPGFLCLGVLLVSDADSHSRRQWCGIVALLAATLIHEASVIVCLASSILFASFSLGGRPEFKRISLAFLIPAAIALGINALDYFVLHPTPSLTGPVDFFGSLKAPVLVHYLWSFVGAMGVAVFFPWQVQLEIMPDWAHEWMFSQVPAWLSALSGFIVLSMTVAGVFLLTRSFRSDRKDTVYSVAATTFILFFWVTFAICSFRLASRSIDYLYSATYYFSLSSFALCTMLSILLRPVAHHYFKKIAGFLLGAIALAQVIALEPFLRSVEQGQAQLYQVLQKARKELAAKPAACFGGMDPTTLPGIVQRWSPLFRDLKCDRRPEAIPLYLTVQDGMPSLNSAVITPQPAGQRVLFSSASGSAPLHQFSTDITYGTSISFSLSKTSGFDLLLSGPSGSIQMIQVDHNLVSTYGQDGRYSSLPCNPLLSDIHYRVVFTETHLLFLANNILVSAAPHQNLKFGDPMKLQLQPIDSKYVMNLTRFEVELSPAVKQLQFVPPDQAKSVK